MEELRNITFVSKKFILNPREHGWKEKKLEGITLVDKSTIAISNDNDFALKEYKIENFTCAHDQKIQCKKVIPIVDEAKQKTYLWLINFKDIL